MRSAPTFACDQHRSRYVTCDRARHHNRVHSQRQDNQHLLYSNSIDKRSGPTTYYLCNIAKWLIRNSWKRWRAWFPDKDESKAEERSLTGSSLGRWDLLLLWPCRTLVAIRIMWSGTSWQPPTVSSSFYSKHEEIAPLMAMQHVRGDLVVLWHSN